MPSSTTATLTQLQIQPVLERRQNFGLESCYAVTLLRI